LDHPNGVLIVVIFRNHNTAVNILYASSFEFGFDDFGELEEDFHIEATTYDFEKDGNPEIIVAVGDGLVQLAVNVFKYHPPASTEDASRWENWSLLGNFTGQAKMILSDDAIVLPFGSQGLFEEFSWFKGKFVQTN
jgi:hypothetical protein